MSSVTPSAGHRPAASSGVEGGEEGSVRTERERPSWVHALVLVLIDVVYFAPVMGRGFMLDDFGHVFVAHFESLRFGLLRASGGPFYAPVAYLTFKLDWLLWGFHPFAWAATNLALHIVTTLLIYRFALRLWHSRDAALWSGLAFTVCFPANMSAVMFIGTRAHVVTTMFCLLAMLAALSFARDEAPRGRGVMFMTLFFALSLFSKENGLATAVAIVAVVSHQRLQRRELLRDLALMIPPLTLVLGGYLFLRSRSGALMPGFTENTTYRYLTSARLTAEGLALFALRTFGIAAVVMLALAIAATIRGAGLRWPSWRDALLALAIWFAAIAPLALTIRRSEIYTYLPGVGAALLAGSLVRAAPGSSAPRLRRAVALIPIVCVVAAGFFATRIAGAKYVRLAETNSMVLASLVEQLPHPPRDAFVRIVYEREDVVNRFPEGFAFKADAFPWALRDLYSTRRVHGTISRSDETPPLRADEIRLRYVAEPHPRVVK